MLRPVPQDLVPESVVGHPALDEPFVRAVLAAPTAGKIPAINRYLAEVIARDTGIDDVPEVRAALDALRAGSPGPALRQRVRHLVERYRQGIREGRESLERVHAASGIVAALDPDPIKGSGEVFGAASYTLRASHHRVQYIVLQRCRDCAVSQERWRSAVDDTVLGRCRGGAVTHSRLASPIKGDRIDQGQTHVDLRSNHVRLPLIDGEGAEKARRRRGEGAEKARRTSRGGRGRVEKRG
ncbi:hypothetical protein [Micromonospora sp. CPCC 206061]|uniref:hypothetical protein n=1 Tax=Micromonospora sp. CPCC 206061 TaxID=3122410 RepID=UPI002FF17850